MKTTELKVVRIGNSRGVRIPAATLARYHIGTGVVMEERPEGLFLHPKPPQIDKLSWAETALDMARSSEDWREWDAIAGEGLDAIPWEDRPARVAEERATYGAPRDPKHRKPARRSDS